MIEKLTFGLFSKEDSKSFMRLMEYARPFKARIVVALISIFLVAATESYLAAFIAPLVNLGFAPPQPAPDLPGPEGWFETILHIKDRMSHFIWGTEKKVVMVPIFFMMLVLIRGVGRYLSSYLLSWVSVMAISHLRADMFNKMLHLSSKYQQGEPSGAITTRFLVFADTAISNASNVFITLTRDTMIVLGLVFVLVYLNWQLSLIVLVMFPVLSWLSRYYRDRMKKIIHGAQAGIADMSIVINEVHQGHRVVKLFDGFKNAVDRFQFVNEKIVVLNKKMSQASAARSPYSEIIASLALAIVIYVALLQSQTGHTTIGEFMAFIVAMLQMVSPIKNLSNISMPMQGMFLASDAVCDFLDVPDEKDEGTIELAKARGEIRYIDVTVKYNDQAQKALDGFNLLIKPSEKVAFVGRSGSGKTTAVNLLTRFVEPTSGHIEIDGVDIDEIRLADLRKQFALVSQDVFLFDDTLRNNVAYARPDASDEDIQVALKAANLWNLVENSPDGIYQRIGANGNQLSGGQRQRVSIARAILKDAPILLLDEATSALDNESERLVQQALERLMEGRTNIIVAHRLTTIEGADRIVVMDEGRIIEQGSHEYLINIKGYYDRLYNAIESE